MIDRFKRVLMRLREIQSSGNYSDKEIRLAIMEECGTDERTIKSTIEKMRELKMLEPAGLGKLKEPGTRTSEEINDALA